MCSSRERGSSERAWARRVADKLNRARDAIAAHRQEVEGPDGLYEELRFEAPRLLPRVHQLMTQLERIEREATDLATEVRRVEDGDLQGLPSIRGDAEHLLMSLRDVMAKESDLMFERFNEPPALD